ncbi:MAG: exopolysaccharide biosynthesis protein [Burkholderiales bacterium]|nr:exopolysaccharide biosynthesis protein [Burkholderiales bacterium]
MIREAGERLFLSPSDVPENVLSDETTGPDRIRVWVDRALALVLLVVFSPVMAALACAIRRDGGPATFAHYRVGRGGRLFKCIKFRTMRVDAQRVLGEVLERDVTLRAEWESRRKLAHDPRVTTLGRVLRESSLDELPQLLNVLRGEMALVGPRPITVEELRRYAGARWHYLSVLPGMTGLWQVSGRNETAYERRVELDELYVKNRSAWLDCKILAKTVVVVLTRQGAC